jgi:predicted nucleic acid-binding protein
MTARCFADTNVFVYAASHAVEDRTKKRIARALLSDEDIGLSAQVLQEFYAVATAKNRLGISPDEARHAVEAMSKFPTAPITADLVKEAITLSAAYRLSYWDAAIVTAAQSLGCRILYSEDLNNGQAFGNLEVRNPFV